MSAKSASKHRTMAEQADIHELYELSVQNVENEIEFLQTTFKTLTGRTAFLFREDFCGTASASCQWVDDSVLPLCRGGRHSGPRQSLECQCSRLHLLQVLLVYPSYFSFFRFG